MKTLQEIKDDYAKKQGYPFDNWNDLVDYFVYWDQEKLHNCIDQVMKDFALEVAKEALRNAADNATMEPNGMLLQIDKESILSETNIPDL